MSPKANKAADNGELSLPSFRDGEKFTVRPLTFGGMKAVAKAGEDEVSQMDVMDVMLNITLKRVFPNVTPEEIDDIEQPDIVTLSNAISVANGDLEEDFTPPPNTEK
jgi:hypothetical protein